MMYELKIQCKGLIVAMMKHRCPLLQGGLVFFLRSVLYKKIVTFFISFSRLTKTQFTVQTSQRPNARRRFFFVYIFLKNLVRMKVTIILIERRIYLQNTQD